MERFGNKNPHLHKAGGTLPASLMNKRTTKLFTKSENAKIQKRVAKTKILVK